MELELKPLDLDLSIAKLSESIGLDELTRKANFISFTKTEQEISLVIDTESLPENRFASTGWKAIMISGPLDFSLVGILQQVIQPLAENGITIFTISTFDTDYILVRQDQAKRALDILGEKFVIK